MTNLLVGCATLPSSDITWRDQQTQLNQIQNFQIRGKIALKTYHQAFSATLFWKQRDETYSIRLFGPFGIGTIHVDGRPQFVTLQINQEQIFTAKSPEQLLQQQLGWHLPISNLYYWIRGLPVPEEKVTLRFDRYHRLIDVQQKGWEIQYLDYMLTKKGYLLPTKLFLSNELLQARIVITKWQQ